MSPAALHIVARGLELCPDCLHIQGPDLSAIWSTPSRSCCVSDSWGGLVPSLFLLVCSLAEPLLPSGNGWGVYKRKKGLVKDLFKSMSSGASRANAHITT